MIDVAYDQVGKASERLASIYFYFCTALADHGMVAHGFGTRLSISRRDMKGAVPR